jgi:hypothetical protein
MRSVEYRVTTVVHQGRGRDGAGCVARAAEREAAVSVLPEEPPEEPPEELPEELPDEPEVLLTALAPPASTVTIAAARIQPPMALPSPMTGLPSARTPEEHRQPRVLPFFPATAGSMHDHSIVLTMLQAARSR